MPSVLVSLTSELRIVSLSPRKYPATREQWEMVTFSRVVPTTSRP